MVKNLAKYIVILLSCWQMNALANIEVSKRAKTFESEGLYKLIDKKISDKLLDSDDMVVRYYFSFNCPYCRSLQPFMYTWGNTLPGNLKYKMVPVVSSSEESALLAMAYLFAEKNIVDIELLDKFVNNMFLHTHKADSIALLGRLVKEALVASGADFARFVDFMVDPNTALRLEKMALIQNGIGIDRTPSLVVGGRYMTNLDHANGENKKFIELINGVTSLYLHGVMNGV